MESTTIINMKSSYKYEAARQKMKQALTKLGINIENHETQLRVLQKYERIDNGKLSLQFDLKNQSKELKSETTIVNNDVFIPVGIALGFLKTPIISGLKFEDIENQKILYFNSETVFSYTKPNTVSQAKALESLYFSKITFVSGNDNVVNEFPTMELKRVPEKKIEGSYLYNDGKYFMLTEFPILDGSNSNVVKIDVPSADTESASGDTDKEKTYVVLQLIGFNISGLSGQLNYRCIE